MNPEQPTLSQSPSFWLLLRWEFVKLLRRRRTYLGFLGFLVIEILLIALLQREDVAIVLKNQMLAAGFTFDANFSGPTVAHFLLGYTISTLGALYMALVAGDLVAREVEDGTMRMLLCQPVSRNRILGVKLLTALAYSSALTIFIATSSLAIGIAWIGPGRLFVHNPLERVIVSHPFSQGVSIYLFEALPLLTLAMWTVAVLAFSLSCLKIKPVVATVAALSIVFIDNLLRGIPFFENIRHFFLTNYMASWIRVYLEHPPTTTILLNYAFLLLLNAGLVAAAFWIFNRRDLKP